MKQHESVFDYVFVATYLSIDKLNDSFVKLIPVQKDTLFSCICSVALAQAMNLFTLYELVTIVFNLYNYFEIRILLLLIAIMYLFNYFYFQKSGRYKRLLRKIKPSKSWYAISICYVVFSTFIAFAIVVWHTYIVRGELLWW